MLFCCFEMEGLNRILSFIGRLNKKNLPKRSFSKELDDFVIFDGLRLWYFGLIGGRLKRLFWGCLLIIFFIIFKKTQLISSS